MYLRNLGDGPSRSILPHRTPADLEAAIAAFAEALEDHPADAADRPAILQRLGVGLRDRYDGERNPGRPRGGDPAYAGGPGRHSGRCPGRPDRTSATLGLACGDRYRRSQCTGGPRGGDRSLPRGGRGHSGRRPRPTWRISATSGDVPARPLRSTGRRRRTSRRPSMPSGRRAELGLTLAPAITLSTAQTWGAWAGEREAWAEAVEAYGDGLAAIDQLYRTQLLPGAKQTWLPGRPGPRRSGRLRPGPDRRLAGAFLALERGRARLLDRGDPARSCRPRRRRDAETPPRTPPTSRPPRRAPRARERRSARPGPPGRMRSRRGPADDVQDQARQARARPAGGDRAHPASCRGMPRSASRRRSMRWPRRPSPAGPLVAP